MNDDIVQRLRDRAYSGKSVDRLCEEAADVIERMRGTDGEDAVAEPVAWMPLTPSEGTYIDKLKAEISLLKDAIRRLADQDATLSVVGGNVNVEMDATLPDAERERLKEYAEGWKIAWQNERGVNDQLIRLARMMQ